MCHFSLVPEVEPLKNCRSGKKKDQKLHHKQTEINSTILFETNCSVLFLYNSREYHQITNIAISVQHGKFHMRVGKPLWSHNRYEILMTSVKHPKSTTKFNLDDFVLEPYLPFNITSVGTVQVYVEDSYFGKSIKVHKHVTYVNSTKWPHNTLNAFKGHLDSMLLGRTLRNLPTYGSLLFDRWYCPSIRNTGDLPFLSLQLLFWNVQVKGQWHLQVGLNPKTRQACFWLPEMLH